jgi:hypothetical protein
MMDFTAARITPPGHDTYQLRSSSSSLPEYDYLVGPCPHCTSLRFTLFQLHPHFYAPCVRDGRILHLCGTSSLQGPQGALSFPFRKPFRCQGFLRLENIVHVRIIAYLLQQL